jgi:hypothetical protein
MLIQNYWVHLFWVNYQSINKFAEKWGEVANVQTWELKGVGIPN